MRLGLVAGFGEVIPANDFALLHDLGVESIRTDLALSPTPEVRQAAIAQLEEAWATRRQIRPFYIVRYEDLPLLPDGALCELLNEPDLHGWTPTRYALQARLALAYATTHGLTCYIGSVSNCSRTALGWLQDVLQRCPEATHVSVHRYPRKYTQSPTAPHQGFSSRAAEVAAVNAIVGPRILACTEAGFHLAEFKTGICPGATKRLSEDEQLTYTEYEVRTWREAGAALVHLYQFQDGPQDVAIERYGHRTVDKRLRKVSMIFPAPVPGPDPEPEPDPWPTWTPEELLAWRGAITMPCAGVPTFGLDWPLLFTAQGYDSVYTDEERATARVAFLADGYTHWPYGPLLQKGYHDQWPSTDFRADPSQFLDRARELRRAGIIPCLFLLDDQGVYAAEHGGVNRDAIERDLTPMYAQPEWQDLFPIVVAAWEPRWPAADWQWVCAWMARVWPNAVRAIHFLSGMGAPGRHEDLAAEGGPYENEAALWNGVIPHIHIYLMQETWVFTGDQVEAGRTPEQQFEYDLLDKTRRMVYGAGSNAPTDGPEVDRWDATRGTDGKPYWQWDGTYSRVCATGGPLAVCAFEYGSYVLKQNGPSVYPEMQAWGALALTVRNLSGFGDGGPA